MSSPLTPFETWWHNEGSELSPLPGEDYEQHARRVSAIAWENGAFSAAPALRQIYDRTEGYADGAPDASPHDRLCNEIADLAKKGARPMKHIFVVGLPDTTGGMCWLAGYESDPTRYYTASCALRFSSEKDAEEGIEKARATHPHKEREYVIIPEEEMEDFNQ